VPSTAELPRDSTQQTPPTPNGNERPDIVPPADGATPATAVQAIADINARLAGGGQVAGTGMVITASGEVLTNNHVIEATTSITVQLGGTGTSYAARVIGEDPTDDVALMQIEGASALATVPIGDSATLSVGQAVTALGNAFGRGGAPARAEGVITALDQTITAGDGSGSAETLSGMIEINAAIAPGDSGGPVIDSAGRVIGMTTAGSQNGRVSTRPGAGFAVAINKAMAVVRQIEAGGGGSANIHIGPGPLLGVEVDSQSRDGALVAGVTTGGPAAAAGITAGDRITALAGRPVGSAADLRTILRQYTPGQRITVRWVTSAGAARSATVALASGPPI